MNEEKFVIDNDKKADWAIVQIKEAESERDRLICLAEEQIEDLKNKINELNVKCDNDTAYLKVMLDEYFRTVPHKSTKTQETYKLLSGTLVFKKPSVKINHDDEKLIGLYRGTEFVETTEKFKWGEFKKDLAIVGEEVMNTITGEIVDCCTVEEVPASFNVKY